MTDPNANPYQSPSSASAAAAELNDMGGPTRAKSPKVFGILSIIFAVVGLIGAVANFAMMSSNPQQQQMVEAMGYSTTYMIISQVIGLALSVLLLVTGIQLVKYRDQGRVLFNIYAWITIVVTALNSVYTFYMLSGSPLLADGDPAMKGGLIGGLIGGFLGALIYPVLGMVFLNKPYTKQSLS